MRTWNYNVTCNGRNTKIMRYPDGDLAIFQSEDNHNPGDIYSPKVDCIRISEKELRKILKDKKRFPRQKKPKRGKK